MMIRKAFSASMALIVGLAVASSAIAGPVTSSVDVQVNDALVLAAPGELTATGDAAAAAALFNDYGSAALTPEGLTLLEGLAGPSAWGTETVVRYSVTTSASVSTIGGMVSTPTPTTLTVPPDSLLKQSSGGDFPDAGISTTSSIGTAPTFATGTGSVLTPLSATIDADTGVGAADESFANATANSFNRVVSIAVADAATLEALGVGNNGMDSFTVNLYLNTLLASIDLDTTSLGDFSFGQFDINATASVNDVEVDANGLTRSREMTNGADLDGTVAAPGGGDFTGLGPSTSGGLGATPFLSFDVSANDVLEVTIDVTSTSQAQVINPIPEPASMMLLGLGAVVLSVYSIRRQRQSTV